MLQKTFCVPNNGHISPLYTSLDYMLRGLRFYECLNRDDASSRWPRLTQGTKFAPTAYLRSTRRKNLALHFKIVVRDDEEVVMRHPTCCILPTADEDAIMSRIVLMLMLV